MIRLSRQAVFISDSNYFAQGALFVRLVKLALTESGAWPMLKFVQQGFKGWSQSEGDGIFYSYSVFNDVPLLQKHFRNVLVIPVGEDAKTTVTNPKLRAPNVLVAGLHRLVESNV